MTSADLDPPPAGGRPLTSSGRRTRPDPRTLDALFRPRSVAVVGASTRGGTIGRELVRNIIAGDFQGKLFPVNPKAEFISSIKAYPSVIDIPDAVDLAVIAVPAEVVVETAEQCGEKGVKGLVVISAGFREVGAAGLEREEALLEVCLRHGMRLVGPNCLGIFNADSAVQLNATFAPGVPLHGPVGFVSQSGALGIAVWGTMQKLGVGMSQFVSVGNRADVSANDLLESWADDPATTVIAMYIESFGEPRRFFRLARQITRNKPILVVKSGRTTAGARAATSHTGALSGLDAATDALLRQTGVIRARTIDDMLALIQAFTRCPLPKGDRVAVLTNAGGPGILATDALIGYGLDLAELSEETRKALRDRLPVEASVGNPVDMIAAARPDAFRTCLSILLACEEVDLAIVAFVPPMMVDPMEVMEAVTEVRRNHGKPVYMVLMAEEEDFERVPRELLDCPPLYRYPEIAAYAAAEMVAHAHRAHRDDGAIPALEADRAAAAAVLLVAGRPGAYLDQAAAFQILEAYGFPIAPWRCVQTTDEAIAAAAAIGYPLALKVAGSHVVHKSDVGGVILGIDNALELEGGLARMDRSLAAAGHKTTGGFVLQRMIPAEREVILGMHTDPVIGPVILFGLGGRYVEVLQDVALRVHPITDVDAKEMVASIRGYPILSGVRGEPSVSLTTLYDALLRLSALVTDFEQIAEIDLNPFLLGPHPSDCRVVDVRIRLGS
jgi:acetyl coenzyme A synthetase (ADP forming)-like protein